MQRLSFSAKACAAPGSCATPADAWAPSLGPPPSVHQESAGAAPPTSVAAGSAGHLINVGSPLVVGLEPALAESLTTQGRSRPFYGQGLAGSGSSTPTLPLDEHFRAADLFDHEHEHTILEHTDVVDNIDDPSRPRTRRRTLAPGLGTPGTSWGAGTPSSTVVDAAVTDLSTHQVVGTQQFVLFWEPRHLSTPVSRARSASGPLLGQDLGGAAGGPGRPVPTGHAAASGGPVGQCAGSGELHQPPVPRLRLRPGHVRPVYFRSP